MIPAVGSNSLQSLLKSGAARIAQEIRNLQTRLALLKQNLGAAEKSAITKDGIVAVQQLKIQINTLEARIARLTAQLTHESNSLSVSPARKPDPTSIRSRVSDWIDDHLIRIYA